MRSCHQVPPVQPAHHKFDGSAGFTATGTDGGRMADDLPPNTTAQQEKQDKKVGEEDDAHENGMHADDTLDNNVHQKGAQDAHDGAHESADGDTHGGAVGEAVDVDDTVSLGDTDAGDQSAVRCPLSHPCPAHA